MLGVIWAVWAKKMAKIAQNPLHFTISVTAVGDKILRGTFGVDFGPSPKSVHTPNFDFRRRNRLKREGGGLSGGGYGKYRI